MAKKKDEFGIDNGSTAVAETVAAKKTVKSKRVRFLELAPKRVTVALKKIGYVKNLANKASYEYTAEEAKRIQEALWGAVDLVVKAFEGQAEKPSGFTF